MMQYLNHILFFVLMFAAFSRADVIRIDANGNVIGGSVRAEIPDTFKTDDGATINNYKHATYRHHDDGWRDASLYEQVSIDVVTTNAIAPELQLTIATYAAVIQSIFGEGAHLDTNITEEVVVQTIAGSTNIPLPVITALKIARDELRGQFTGHFSTLPYAQTERVVTNASTQWILKQ